MKRLLLLSIILPFFGKCQHHSEATSTTKPLAANEEYDKGINPFATIRDIQVPGGYERVQTSDNSFGMFLRNIPLKKSKIVYLFNGKQKMNQDAQFAVLDVRTGKKDLQQCADAVMRLRAEYLYQEGRYVEIKFSDNANGNYHFRGQANRNEFELYLEKVFSYCGTLSLEKQLKKRSGINQAEIGDVLIKGGSPGHAMIIVDMAINKEGKKIILLSQSYMPAQDIHVVINPMDSKMSPWYLIDNESDIITPEWTFRPTHLRYW